ncbi:MAG: hypothetical protein CSA21_07590 [Deltaproteobacteria bacterium]|nr:MAG: hypothetical protein CSA21_07590 [Deltaproteobacteria bacterium]
MVFLRNGSHKHIGNSGKASNLLFFANFKAKFNSRLVLKPNKVLPGRLLAIYVHLIKGCRLCKKGFFKIDYVK